MPPSFHPFKHIKRSRSDNRNLPSVKSSNPTTEFVDNRVAADGCRKYDIATIDSNPTKTHDPLKHILSEQRDEPVPQDKGEDFHRKRFAETLQSFESSLPDKYKTRFDLHGEHTWPDVIREATITEMKYKKKAIKESHYGKVRGYFRSLQKESVAVESWLDMLPNEIEYWRLICGGFKVILRAAARMDEIKEFMVKGMAAIPDEVEKAQLMIKYDKGKDKSQRLYSRLSFMYHAVFGILEHIIVWYNEKSAFKQTKPIIQQEIYERELEEKINSFKNSIRDVKDEAKLCGIHRLFNMNGDRQYLINILQGVIKTLRSSPRLDPKTVHVLQYEDIITPPTRTRKGISSESLCESVLKYDEAILQEDLTAVMHRGIDLSLKEQDQTVYVIRSPILRDWFLIPENSVLLIRGGSEEVESGAPAMSFIAGHVIQSTREAYKEQLVCLYWFAGQHRNVRNDANANIRGIVRSLIGQLVHIYSGFDLYFIKRGLAIAMCNNDLESLCYVFEELVYQLPGKLVVFCVIDSLAFLEYYHTEEVRFLLNSLHSIARHVNEKGSLFKLLLTHTGGAFRGAATFDGPGETLHVPEDGTGDRMGFSTLLWDIEVGSRIDHVAGKREQSKEE
ncbi:hypothetical protein F4810DRAFT_653159 [Camillea tinctor]|nr:hypothetical protein F4810DRAFT_653159 [Camillea tinctor]